MHIAIGHRWLAGSPTEYLEDNLRRLGHTVTHVGASAADRPGYDHTHPVSAVLERLNPPADVFWMYDPSPYSFPPGIEDLPIPTACWLIDVHIGQWRYAAAQFYDAVFVAQSDYVTPFKRAVGHDQVYWLPLCIDPRVHRRLDMPRIYQAGFVGNLSRAHRSTPRGRRLRALSQRYRTNDFFRSYNAGEMCAVYSQSQMVVNVSIKGDVNYRAFEGAACGALVLNDSRANSLETLFEIGRETVVYDNDQDLYEKLDYYLTHEAERAALAEAAHQRAMTEHTYAQRLPDALKRLQAPGFQRAAPMRRATARQRALTRRAVYTSLYMLDAILDDARNLGENPAQRLSAILPCLARRLLR